MTIIHAHLILPTGSIPYSVRYSPRAKKYRISVSSSGVELVLPKNVPLLEASDLMFKHRAWISAQVLRIEKTKSKHAYQPPQPGIVLYRGVPFQIEIIRNGNQKPALWINENSKIMSLIIPNRSKSSPISLLEAQLKQHARRLLKKAVQIRSDLQGVKPGLITIRDQHTRWGSCSSKGTISLNWRLIMAPLEVMDYVISHELCHLLENNHSKRFWRLVQTYCPNYLMHKEWLKENGNRLRPVIE